VITIVALFIIAALLATLSGLISDEVRGWLDRVPLGILWLVALRLPVGLRQVVYREEWLPDLIEHLQKADGRPITRLIFGIGYAADMARGAGKVGRELDGVREPDEVPRVYVQDADSGATDEIPDIYKDAFVDGGLASRGGVTVTDAGVRASSAGIRFSGEGMVATASMGKPGPDQT
jgi:hypothetical protein